MTEKELDARIDKAPAQKVRACLKEIASLWFVEESYPLKTGAERIRTVSFDKHIDSDIIEAVTGALHTRGFSPKEGE